jgi:hypothetical protein
MMERNGYTIHRLARFVLQQLDEDERARVLACMQSLVTTPVG